MGRSRVSSLELVVELSFESMLREESNREIIRMEAQGSVL